MKETGTRLLPRLVPSSPTHIQDAHRTLTLGSVEHAPRTGFVHRGFEYRPLV